MRKLRHNTVATLVDPETRNLYIEPSHATYTRKQRILGPSMQVRSRATVHQAGLFKQVKQGRAEKPCTQEPRDGLHYRYKDAK